MDGRTDIEDLMKMFVILLHTNVGVAQEKKTLEKKCNIPNWQQYVVCRPK